MEAKGLDSEMVLVNIDAHILITTISSFEHNIKIVQLHTPQLHLGSSKANGFREEDGEVTVTETTWDSHYFSDLEVSSIKRILSLHLLKITTLLYIRAFLIVLELNILVKIKKVMGNIPNFQKYAMVKKLTKNMRQNRVKKMKNLLIKGLDIQ